MTNQSQQYTSLKIFTSDSDKQDLLVAQLSELGFEGFFQEDDAVTTYIDKDLYDEIKSTSNLSELLREHQLKFEENKIEPQNWNEEWEKNFEPIVIENRISIRADFHPKRNDLEFDIVINPKMSFGTGHHDTTAMMMKYMLGINMIDAEVLDFGSGTGILSILASKLGAKYVLAIDNDPNACLNAQENLVQNLVTNVEVKMCDILGTGEHSFDDILANINRNTILHDFTILYNMLKPNGALLISGILKSDMSMIVNASTELGLVMTGSLQSDQWAALCFKKSS